MNRGCTFVGSGVLFDMNRFPMTEDIHAETHSGRGSMADRRTVATEGQAPPPRASWTQTHYQPPSAHRYSVRAANRYSVDGAAAGDGLRLGGELLAASGQLATCRGVDATASRV